MADRKKLELQLNQPAALELLFDDPVVGQSQYGDYYLYAVKQGNGQEYSFFAPDEVHDKIKTLKKGSKVTITKLVEQKGTKILTKYDIQIMPISKSELGNGSLVTQKDNYFQVMLESYQDSLKIQEQLNGMVDVNKIAICLFIARSKVNGNGFGG